MSKDKKAVGGKKIKTTGFTGGFARAPPISRLFNAFSVFLTRYVMHKGHKQYQRPRYPRSGVRKAQCAKRPQ